MILGFAMLIPALVDVIDKNSDWLAFLLAALITIVSGALLFLANRGVPRRLSTRQAMLMTVMVWVALVLFGALPYIFSGATVTITDAVFESMSGLTTTGATVILGLDQTPIGVLTWRALQQWLGGLGIIVMAVAVLPMLQIGGMQVFKAEAFDTAEKILPRATQISTSMTLVFALITLLCAASYLVAGLSPSDAMLHAMTTVATGGFSTRDASFAAFDNAAAEWVAVVFMLAGSIPFLLFVQLLRGQPLPIFKDSQVRAFASIVAVIILLGWVFAREAGVEGGHALRQAAFNGISILTGTGYASTDYGSWGAGATAFFFAIMFIGGCAGSTSCGIKVFRFQVMMIEIAHHIRQMIYPNGVFIRRYNGRALEGRTSAAVASFFFLYFASFFIIAAALQATGLDFLTAISAAGTAISNVGPGLGTEIGPTGNFAGLHDPSKWIIIFGMLLGRLELFTVLVILMPRFWRV